MTLAPPLKHTHTNTLCCKALSLGINVYEHLTYKNKPRIKYEVIYLKVKVHLVESYLPQ